MTNRGLNGLIPNGSLGSLSIPYELAEARAPLADLKRGDGAEAKYRALDLPYSFWR